jgi:uncharacterized protein YecE (DUF72 family)
MGSKIKDEYTNLLNICLLSSMEFGYIDGKLSDIDFSLPDDPEVTTKTLIAAGKTGELQVYVGGTKWSEKRWVGKIYPKKTPETEFLRIYVNNFNTIEFGPTFYSIQTPEAIRKWAKMADDSPGFKFCPKFPQTITHVRGLKNSHKQTESFYQSLDAFGDHLGPLLLQLGESFSTKLFLHLKEYLESLPTNFKVAVEVRNRDWFAVDAHRNNLFRLLSDLNISWIMSDTKGRRDCVHMHLPTPNAVIRFVGNNLDETDYARIDAWVERFALWKDQGLQSLWFFVHQFDEAAVPDLCDYVIRQLNEKLGTSLQAPNLIKD